MLCDQPRFVSAPEVKNPAAFVLDGSNSAACRSMKAAPGDGSVAGPAQIRRVVNAETSGFPDSVRVKLIDAVAQIVAGKLEDATLRYSLDPLANGRHEVGGLVRVDYSDVGGSVLLAALSRSWRIGISYTSPDPFRE